MQLYTPKSPSCQTGRGAPGIPPCTGVQYVDFCIENPHKILANGDKYTTNQMEFDTNPKHNKIFLSTHANKQESVAGDTVGIYVNQV